MWKNLVLQIIVYGIIILCVTIKVFMPVIRFQISFKKVLKINNKIRNFMNENPYLLEGKYASKEKRQKDFGILLDNAYEMKDELKRALAYYEQIPYYIAKLCKMDAISDQLYELLRATNKTIWITRCNV